MSPGAGTGGPAVLVMARTPKHDQLRGELRPRLGSEGVARLQEALLRRTLRWAQAVAPGAVHVAGEPAGEEAWLQALGPAGAEVFGQEGSEAADRVPAAVSRVFRRHGGPLLVLWPELARWRPEHAEAALGDLEAGCQVTLGPLLDGGLYLFGLLEDRPDLFGLAGRAWRAADAMAIGFQAARDAGLEVGFLRSERGLGHPADLDAALADPLLADELRALLGPSGAESGGG